MNARPRENANQDFFAGLMIGSVIGAGLAILFAPGLTPKLHQAMTDSAGFGNAASQRYQDVTTRIEEVVDAVTTREEALRDDVADAASKSGHTANDRARRARRVNIHVRKK
jgi:gas vesicle protein